jgi:16S rRNA (cytosine967-C5)-methyltransferase
MTTPSFKPIDSPENSALDTGLKIRHLALKVLLELERKENFRHKAASLLEDFQQHDKSFSKAQFHQSDKRLLKALTFGVLRWQARLDAWIEILSKRSVKRLDVNVRCLLRLGLFQLHGLDGIPDYAAIDTTVKLARKIRCREVSIKFINANLREAQRRLASGSLPGAGIVPEADKLPLAEHLLYEAAWPVAWTETVLKQYPESTVTEMAEAWKSPAPIMLRVNTLKINEVDFQKALNEAQITFEECSLTDAEPSLEDFSKPMGIRLTDRELDIRSLPGYAEGWFYVQDLASMWVPCLLNPKAGESILDLCAAPGSKTTQIAALSNNQAQITAVEIAPKRVERLKENFERLGVENVRIIVDDALSESFQSSLKEASLEGFDKVLVDAPCSGSGTIRRHPEILRHLPPNSYTEFTGTQLALLQRGASLLKAGGILVYSTCSILSAENAMLIQKFLEQSPQFSLQYELQRPITDLNDGFYAAVLEKMH